jgi:hypothetical protein
MLLCILSRTLGNSIWDVGAYAPTTEMDILKVLKKFQTKILHLRLNILCVHIKFRET